jgi:AcrR family transcriptional regulator
MFNETARLSRVSSKFENARVEQRERTAARIRGAARALIAKRGFSGTTIRAIAEREGIAPGTVIARFGSKEDLFFEVFYEDLESLAERGVEAAAGAQGLAERLIILANTLLRGFADNPPLYGELMRHGLLARGPWGQRFEAQVHRLGVRIAPWYRAHLGAVRSDSRIDVAAAVATYFALYYFVLLQQLKTDFEELEAGLAMLRDLVNLHVRGLS